MAQVPHTEVFMDGDGVTTIFDFDFPYQNKNEVFVSVNGVDTPYVWLAGSEYSVQVTPAPALGTKLRIYRSTMAYVPLHVFDAGVPFLPRYVDENNRQLLFAAQEAINATAGTASQALAVAEEAKDIAERAEDKIDGAIIDSAFQLRQDLFAAAGAGMVGYDATLNYPANSAGSALKGVVASANSAAAVAAEATAEASRLATTGTFGNAQMLTRIRARISNAPTMYVLGDSISHGAFAGNIYRHSWVNLFRRMIYNEVGTLSYGFTPTLALFDPLGVAQKEIHDIDILGTWDVRGSETGSHVAQGVSFVSNGTGNSIKSTVPTFQDSCTVYYVSRPGGGTFDIKVNGVKVTSVDTTSASIDPIVGMSVPLKDNRSGICTIEVVTTSTATVEVCGFSYGGAYSDAVLHNFSTSGRRLRWLDENTISRMMQGTSLFIMALGINDLSQNESDPSYFSEFVTRISWLIQYANQYKVPMVVPDFVWSYPSTNKTRQQLKRLADETQGIYIPFPDYFRKGSQSADASYLINELKLFTDEAHPNVDGHKYIAETIAKKLGLGVTSKKEALDFHDWWFPLYLGSSAIKNLDFGTEPPSRLTSATKNDGSCVLLRLNLAGVTGTSPVQLCGVYSPSSGVFIDFPVTGQLQPENNGASAGLVSVSATGVVVSPNSTNTRTNHKVLVVVPRGERPFVNGVIY